MDTIMVAVPKIVDISGRKHINAAAVVTELQSLSQMSLYNPAVIGHLREYLKQHQIELWEQNFSVEEGVIKKGQVSKGTNFWGVVEGRRTHGLECFVLAFDPGNFKLLANSYDVAALITFLDSHLLNPSRLN